MSEDERRLAEESDLLRGALGNPVFETLLAEKRREWETYRSQVTSWELERYLGIL